MIYKIDKVINFREDDGAIWRTTEQDAVVRLSITPARILSYLLEHKDRIIDRNELLGNIWDKYGFQASNHSLSQNISVLRKVFNELGYEQELIQTIPKIGFRINMDINIETEASFSSIIQNPISEEIKDTSIEQVTFSVNGAGSKKSSPWVSYLLLIISVITSIFLTFKLGHIVKEDNNQQLPASKLYPIGHIQQCPIYTVYQSSEKVRLMQVADAIKISKDNMPCIDNAFYVFQSDDNFTYSHKGRVFLSRCTVSKDDTSKILGCKDIYINEN